MTDEIKMGEAGEENVFSYFPEALELLKSGKMVTRLNWSDGVSVMLVPNSLTQVDGQEKPLPVRPHFLMVQPDEINVWTPTTQDILADDWREVA